LPLTRDGEPFMLEVLDDEARERVSFRPVIMDKNTYANYDLERYGEMVTVPRVARVLREIGQILLDRATDIEADQLAKGTLDD